MLHTKIIKEKIEPILGTKNFLKFTLFLLNDPHYGSINNIKAQKSRYDDTKAIEATQNVIDLYKEWLITGIKPSNGLWLKAKNDAIICCNNAFTADSTYVAAHAANLDHNSDSISKAASVHTHSTIGIPSSEVETAQIDKLNFLIENKDEDELFTEADYETEEEN